MGMFTPGCPFTHSVRMPPLPCDRAQVFAVECTRPPGIVGGFRLHSRGKPGLHDAHGQREVHNCSGPCSQGRHRGPIIERRRLRTHSPTPYSAGAIASARIVKRCAPTWSGNGVFRGAFGAHPISKSIVML